MIERILEKVYELIIKNLKNPRFYALILVVGLALLIIFPYVDANFFYYERVEKRVSILKDISEINVEAIQNNPVLKSEYDSILEEVRRQKYGNIENIMITTVSESTQKNIFISGGFIFWIFSFLCIIIKSNKSGLIMKIVTAAIVAAFGCICGYIAELIPIIISPIYNIVLVPIVEIILIYLIYTAFSSRNSGS